MVRLALDADDIPRMVYVRTSNSRENYALVYTRRMKGPWGAWTLDSGKLFSRPGFVVDAAGSEHVVYGAWNEALRYGHSAGDDAWVFEDAAPTSIAGSWLALDSARQPHIACSAGEGTWQVSYAYRRGGEWASQVLVNGYWVAAGPLALDSSDNAYMVYTTGNDSYRGSLWLAHTTDAFVPQPPPPPPPPCQNPGGGAGANSGCTQRSGARLYLPLLGQGSSADG